MGTLTPQELLYAEWVRKEAAKINSDGCTAVSEWHQWCCLEHDLGCHYGKDPRSAFQWLLQFQSQEIEGVDPWYLAAELSRRDADKRFAACNFKMSRTPVEYLRSGIRYIGVRIGSLWPF